MSNEDRDTSPPPLPAPTIPLAQPLDPTLAYRNVRDDRAGGTKRFLLHMLGGFGVAALVCGGCFVLLVFVGGKLMDDGSTGKFHPPAFVGWASLTLVTAMLIGLVWWAIRAHRRRARTGFLVGMLIGVGLSLLPLGLCYAIIGGESMK
jgi:protein-S-isoprenylcysteine O-methyltransferase Ste14